MRRWEGRTVVCIGSGPSLTDEDCTHVQKSEVPTIAINSTWKKARFADVIFAGDFNWWDKNIKEVDIPAERWTVSTSARDKFGINILPRKGVGWHSGLRAVQMAEWMGASRVLLLGYDCTIERGVHHHGLHPYTTNPTSSVCKGWRRQFSDLARQLTVPVINCSRHSALNEFPRSTIEAELR